MPDTSNLRELDTPSRAAVRQMIAASDLETTSAGEGYRAKAAGVLSEIRRYDALFGSDTDGIATALICKALWDAKADGIGECREVISFAQRKTGIAPERA